MLVARCTALAWAVAACACNPGEAPSNQPDAGPPTVTLGSGDVAFEALDDGDDIFIVQGAQGGFHFFGSVAVTGIDPGNPNDLGDASNPTTEFRAFRGADRVDAEASRYVQGLRPVDGMPGVGMVGRLVILDILADDDLDGATVRFEVEVTGADGTTASDARTLTAVAHPNNP